MSKSWQAYAHYILDACEKLRRIQARGALTEDDILYDAALRNLQTLSEATQRIPAEMKQTYADIPWQQIAGFRNILVHNYLGDIDPDSVLTVLQQQLPRLEATVRTMLAEDGNE